MKRNPLWLAKLIVRLFVPLQVRGRVSRYLFESIWRKIWLEEGYANLNDIDCIARDYSDYISDSRDIVMTFLFIPIGTLRLVVKRPNLRLPVEKAFDIKRAWENEDSIVEITLLTTLKRFRRMFGGVAALVMMRYSYQKSREIGAKAMVVAADRRLYALLTRVIKLPFHKIGEPRHYEGSITVPAVMFLEEAEDIMPSKNPYIYKLFRKRFGR